MAGEEKRSPGRPKSERFYPMSVLVKAGIYQTLKPGEKVLIICLDDHTNRNTGLCCPSGRLIARETGLDLRTISRARGSLQKRGIFEIKMSRYRRGPREVSHYVWGKVEINKPIITRGKRGQNEAPSPCWTSEKGINQSSLPYKGGNLPPKPTNTREPINNSPKDKERSPEGILGSLGSEEERKGCIPGSRDITKPKGGHGGDQETAALDKALKESREEDAKFWPKLHQRWWTT